jgi:hypothetical protein
MMSTSSPQRGVVPAQLSYLTIYNPAFGDSDETAYEQIFYFYSRSDHERQETAHKIPDRSAGHDRQPTSGEDAKNERLRQVGLARGLVEFAK